MEIFGSTFDDSVFSESRDRASVSVSSYSPKLCESEVTLDTDDSLEKQKVYKFRGDLAVRRGDYQKALDAYSSCLQWIADNNLTIRRDVLEGMARCCTRLGQRERALHLTELKEASNTCHLTSLLLLKVCQNTHTHTHTHTSSVCVLQQLCSLLPFNPWHWLSLGQTCEQLLGRHRSAGTTPSTHTKEFSQDRIWLKACACFIRTRLLLRILQQQQSSFVLRRSESALQLMEEALRRLQPGEPRLQALTEVMSEDLVPEKMREDYQDGESLSSVSLQSFRERWWDKVPEDSAILLTPSADHCGTVKPL
uniref:Zgc:101716 n=1 Tax=Salarias fasciatus TaxID=181472 RepID=A0A672FNI4_SALFA